MSAIAWSDVTDMFPTDTTLSGLPVPAQTDILAEVNGRPETLFDRAETLKLGRIYMAAAMGVTTAAGASAIAGPVTGETAGNISRQYEGTRRISVADAIWGNTSYGRMYFTLLMGAPGARFIR